MDTTATADARDDFSAAVRGGVSAASRGSISTGAARYVSSHTHPPPPHPPPTHHHLSPLHPHHIHHHHLHHSGTSTAATGLLMTGPTGMLDSTDAAAAHYAQSPGSSNASLRTGVPHEIGRPGPPHATPAASVSAPSPLPPLQCQDRFFSSLTINTGSSYAFLNGVPAPTFSAASIPAPMSASSPFRTPPGLASVHSHWSHTPPPSPLDSYGRYGMGANLYSFYPLLTGNDANALCLQASAAKLLQRTSPYYPVLDRNRDFGLYYPANFPIGSPFSPSLSNLDSADLSGGGSSTSVSLPDYLQQRMTTTTTPFDYMCKSTNSGHNNINSVNSCSSTKFSGTKMSVSSSNGATEDEKSKKTSTKDSRSKSSVVGKNVGSSLNGKISVDNNNSRSAASNVNSYKDVKVSRSDTRCCVSGAESSIIKKESKSESCRKKQLTQKLPSNTVADPESLIASPSAVVTGPILSPVNEISQVQALNLSQDVKKPNSHNNSSGGPATNTGNKLSMNDYARLYGTTFLPFDPTQLPLALRLNPSTTSSTVSQQPTVSAYSSTPTTNTTTTASNVCDKNVRVKVEPEVKAPQRPPCPYQNDSPTLRPDNGAERQDRSSSNSRTHYSTNGLNGINGKSGDYHVLNLMTHQHNNDNHHHRREDQLLCCSKDGGRSNGVNDSLQTVAKCHSNSVKKQCGEVVVVHRPSCLTSNEELNNKTTSSDKQLSRLPTPTPPVLQSGKGPPTPTPVNNDITSADECPTTKTNDGKCASTTMIKDETSSKVAVKGSHIESITNKLLAKSQLGVTSEVTPKPAIAQLRVQQHTKCRRKSVVVDKIVAQNETNAEVKHSTSNNSAQPTVTSETSRTSPVQAAPYDYTLKQPSCNSTFTVTTTTPVTPTTTTMALQQITSGSSSSSSFQRCFTEHVHKSMATATSVQSELHMSDHLSSSSSSSSSAASSSSSSPINVTDIDSSPSTKWPSNAQSEDKVLSKFSGKGNGIDVQLFDRKLRPKLSSAHESNSNSSVEGSSIFSHSLTTGMSSIPVGIAVAQQRQEVQTQCKQRSDSINCKQGLSKCGTQSASPLPSKSNEISSSAKSRQISSDILLEKSKMVCFDKSSSNDTSGVVTSSSEFPPGLMITGGAAPLTTSCWANDDKARWFPGGHPALWLGQSSFAGAPSSLSMQLGSADHLAASLPPHPPPPHPFPPIGYQLARDPITNHLFLIPTANINLMERPPLWPAPPTVSQLPTLHKPFQSCIYSPSLPTTSATGASQQQIPSPVLTANRLSQELPNFECPFPPDADKALNMSSVTVSNSQSGPELTPEILSEKSSVVKDENDEKIIGDPSTLTAPSTTITISQPYCFELQSSGVAMAAESANISRTSTPSLPLSCPCHVSPCETKVSVESGLGEQQQPSVDVVGPLKMEVTKMADACNQTETPPLTDEDEEEDSKADLCIAGQSLLSSSMSESKDVSSSVLSMVKVEDMSVQCELSDEIDMSMEDKKDELNVHGLELLSKTIAERNLGVSVADVVMATSTPKLTTVDSLTSECERKEFKLDPCEQTENLTGPDDFGGLGLLCALAEQRILQETTGNTPLSDINVDTKPCKDDETDVSYKIPKTNKVFRHFIAQKVSQYSTSSSSTSSSSSSSMSNSNINKGLADSESTVFNANEMEPAEMEMRLKLADLQKKYKEKQKELAKLARKDSDHSKRKPGRPKKGRKSSKSSFKFHHQLHRAKLTLLSCHKKSYSTANVSVTLTKTSDKSSDSSNSVVAPASRSILNPPTLVTSTPKNMSTLDKWTSSLAACPPSLFQLVPTLKKVSTTTTNSSSGTKSSPSSSIFTNLKQQLPPPPLSSKLSLMASATKSMVTEVDSPNKGQTTTPDETTTETSDSDDSSLCQSNKVKSKPPTSKSRPLVFSSKDQQRMGGSRRRDGLARTGNGIGSRSRGQQSEDQRDDHRSTAEVDLLSLSFSSLSVSCTMPPFKGHDDNVENVKEEDARADATATEEDEASCGLGLLATCASQATTFDQLPSTAVNAADHPTSDRTAEEAAACGDENAEEKKDDLETTTNTAPMTETKPDINGSNDVQSVESTQSQEKTKKEVDQSTSSTTPTKCKYSYLEDEAWLRRRSERIFLNEPSCKGQTPQKPSFQSQNEQFRHKSSSSSSASLHSNNNCSYSSCGGVSREITVSAAVSAVSAVTGLTWKSRPEETKPSKKRGSCKVKSEAEPCLKKMRMAAVTCVKASSPGRQILDSLDKTPLSRSSSESSDSDSPAETSSFSEGDNLPLSQLVDRPTTPAPRSCTIQAEELRDNLRVLTMIDRLFYSGRVVGIRAPDVYGITVDGERGNRPHIYSREEILQEAVVEVKPGSIRYLPEGTRVCAYWSQKYRCLYPGTVAKSTSPSSSPETGERVLVEFDDGDSGRISVDNVRLLPPDLPLISYDRDPLNYGKRRTKSTGDISQEKRTPIMALVDSHKDKTTSRSADKLGSHSDESSTVKSREPLCEPVSNGGKESSSTTNNPTQRKLFDTVKKASGKKVNDEVNNNNSSAQSKLSDLSRIPLVKALYGSQILSATVSVVPLSRSTTPTSSTSSTVSSSGGKPFRSVGAGFSSSSSSSSSLLKARKHKKHKNNKNDNKKRHHHHHRRHRHKHKHEKKLESAQREQTNGVKLAKRENVVEESPVATNVDGKKQELTLKIRTSVDVNRTEVEQKETKRDNEVEGKRRSDEKSVKTTDNSNSDGQITPVNEPDTKNVLLDEPLPPRKARIAKKEDSSVVSSTRPKAKRKERSNSVETKSKIAAFLPARQLWRWSGKSFRRPGAKGKAKKDFYKAITRGKETIRVGDSAVFLSTGRPHLPFIGRIITMWESWGGNMIVKVRWFYHPEETKGGKKLVFNKGALYQSYHIDENDVQTISHKCEVLSWNDYRKYKDQEANQSSGSSVYDNCDVYYLAGSYDPTAGVVTLEEGVS